MDNIDKRLLILVALPNPLASETATDLPRDDNATPR
jgi:hypothetical protein